MMMREVLIQDMQEMEEGLCRTANRTDIWQDRLVYALCKAVLHLLQVEVKRIDKEAKN